MSLEPHGAPAYGAHRGRGDGSSRWRRWGVRILGLVLALVAVTVVTSERAAETDVSRLRNAWTYRPVNAPVLRTIGLAQPAVTPLAEVSPLLVLAVLASEDRRFFSHHGFDVAEVRAAVRDTLRDGRPLRGASTISQQLVKNLFVSDRRSLGRKLHEAIYTVALERRLTKDEILVLYLSTIEWGDGVYGVAAASARYFDAAPAALTLERAAVLSALIPAPLPRGRGLDAGSLRAVGRAAVVRRLRRMHLVVDALAAGDPGALRLADLRAAPLAAIIDAADQTGLPPRVARASHRSWQVLRDTYHPDRAHRVVLGTMTP